MEDSSRTGVNRGLAEFCGLGGAILGGDGGVTSEGGPAVKLLGVGEVICWASAKVAAEAL